MDSFFYHSSLNNSGDHFNLSGTEGYVLLIQGVYISVSPDSYDLANGAANIIIGPFEGLPSSQSFIATFVPVPSACVYLAVPLEAKAVGEGQPVTFTLNTGGGQTLSGVDVNVWGQLIPAND